MEIFYVTDIASNPVEEVADDIEAETPEAEAPETEEAAPETEEAEAEAEASEEEGDGEQEEDDEEIELNFGGEKLRVPKGAIPEEVVAKVSEMSRNLEAGYTRKFQEVAERSKSLEAREGAVEKLVGLQGEALETYSRGLQLRSELDQLTRVDLNSLWQSNPDQARRISDQISAKRAEFERVVNAVSTKEAELTQASAAERQRRSDEGKQVIERRIKDFEKAKPEFFDYVEKTAGLPRDVIERDYALNPEITVAFHKAMLFDQMQAKAKQATAKPKPNTPNPVRPKTGSGGRQTFDPVRDADRLPVDEWLKREKARMAKKGV